jgi:GNAT superfamily N-acetyltransferase
MGVKAVTAERTTPVPGHGVTVRAAVPRDAEGLDRMFSRCSAETIYLRFHSPYPKVPRTMLDLMADVGSRSGKAFVAEIDGEVVGHAMYAREHEGDREADTAVVVEDAWASRGVGRRLFARIREEARRDGVETLLCTTLGDNYRMKDFLRRAFPESRITFSGGACHVRLPLLGMGAASQLVVGEQNASTRPVDGEVRRSCA